MPTFAANYAKGLDLTPRTAEVGLGPRRRTLTDQVVRSRLAQGRAVEALELTKEAIGEVQRKGISPGLHWLDLPLVRVPSLFASGDTDGARAALRAERDRLLACAAAIPDEGYRRSFLEGLPSRVRLLALAREHLDAPG